MVGTGESSSSKPLWLLDIDGVVNAVTGGKPPLHVWKTGWNQAVYRSDDKPTGGFPLIWNDRVVKFIAQVHDEGLAEIVWHSSWRSEATNFGQLAGLPKFQISDAPEWTLYRGGFVRDQILARKSGWWKYPAAERALLSGRQLVWTDDEIKLRMGAAARTHLGTLGPALLISPDLATGLAPWAMKSIGKFLGVS